MQDWKEWQGLNPESGNAIPADRAWRMFAEWKASAKEIGVLFVSQGSTFRAFATIDVARDGAIQLRSESASASFVLKEASFLYGPMQTWPRWPNPPIVEVMALHALLPRGAWLCLAEGLRPEAIPTRMIEM
jgi:hypothetical protein